MKSEPLCDQDYIDYINSKNFEPKVKKAMLKQLHTQELRFVLYVRVLDFVNKRQEK